MTCCPDTSGGRQYDIMRFKYLQSMLPRKHEGITWALLQA